MFIFIVFEFKPKAIEINNNDFKAHVNLGNVYKDTVVARITTQGAWSQVKLRAATTFNTSTKQWNYETKTGWVSSEYLAKVGVDDIPDYRGQVDMGTGGNVSGSGDIKLEDKYLKMTPEVTVNTIKSKYSSAVIKDLNGTELTDTSKMVGTGYSITIDGKAYTGIKYGDVNGDGLVKAADYVFIKNFIMDSSVNPFSDIQKIAGDVNKDGNIRAADYVLIKNYIMTGDKISL